MIVMNVVEKIIEFLKFEIERPSSYGLFHIISVLLCLSVLIFLCIKKEKNHDKSLKRVLLIYGFSSLILEILKQIIWSYSDGVFSYSWYSAPFQLCTMPIYISLIAAFIKKGKVKDSLLSFMAFFTILGSIATIFYPESCFVRTLLVDIHTMVLHLGSFVVSVYLLVKGDVRINYRSLLRGFVVFLVCASIALSLDIIVYNFITTDTFNMFYISPYFTSSLPVFDFVQEHIPYILFLLFYITMIFIGGNFIYLVSLIIKKIRSNK